MENEKSKKKTTAPDLSLIHIFPAESDVVRLSGGENGFGGVRVADASNHTHGDVNGGSDDRRRPGVYRLRVEHG